MKQNKSASWWSLLKDKYGHKRMKATAYILLIGGVSFLIHALFTVGLGHSALLYMLIPYGISVIITFLRSYDEPKTRGERYGRHIGNAFIVLLASSIVLLEGVVCVIFFFPIYFIIVTIEYAFAPSDDNNSKLRSVWVPAIVLVMSLEGTTDFLSLDRNYSVSVTKVTSLSVSEVKENLASPFNLDKKRDWMLSVFPMPYQIEAGSLKAGDVHKIKTRYHRWFVTNTHEGEAELLIEHVGDKRVRTKMVSDTTYFSTYLALNGTQIDFESLATGGTEITLKIDFERKLDPAWYFGPLQKMAVSKMAEFLIDEVMIRESGIH